MTQPAKGQEPSMEEILASIRRIIADDDSAKVPKESALNAAEPKAAEHKAAETKSSEPLPLRPATLPPRMAPPPRPEPPRSSVVLPPAPEPPARQEALDSVLAQLQAARPTAAPLEEPAADILDLTEQMAEPEPGPGFRTIDGEPDVVFDERRAPPPPEPPPPSPPPPRPRYEGGEGGLISATTSAAVDSAFNTLAQTVLVQNGRTLEDLVREMLRPMLKTWLDDNLPSMVERLVRAEIERVSRGRG